MKARVTEKFIASFENGIFEPDRNAVLDGPFAEFCVANSLPVEVIEEDAPTPEPAPSIVTAPEAPQVPEVAAPPVPDVAVSPEVVAPETAQVPDVAQAAPEVAPEPAPSIPQV